MKPITLSVMSKLSFYHDSFLAFEASGRLKNDFVARCSDS